MGLELGKLIELFIAICLAVIGWLISTFTKRHILSMDTLTDKLDLLGRDVHDMRGDIRVLRERQDAIVERVDRVESAQNKWNR